MKCNNIAVKLRLAPYGHPLSGAFWEKQCTDKLRSIGVAPVNSLESSLTHCNLRVILSVYVDDFKMFGPEANMKKAWSLTRGVIAINELRNTIGNALGLRPRSD